MAIINCPECGREISDKAVNCPECGCPIGIGGTPFSSENTYQTQQPIPQQIRAYVPQQKNSGLGIAALILYIVGCTFWLGIILAIVDLCKKDGRKHTCSIIAICVAVAWVILALAIPSDDKTDNTQTSRNTQNVSATVEEPIEEKPVQEQREETQEKPSVEEKDISSSNSDAEEDDVPTEYKSALKKAISYSEMMYMSKAAIYNQLTSEYGEQFTEEAAQYAMDNIEVDWNANALAKAKDYSDSMYMSKEGIYDQLVSEYGEQFTEEEARYAVENLDADWNLNALKKAESYQETMSMSPAAIYDQLISEYGEKFTEEEAQYAIDNLK